MTLKQDPLLTSSLLQASTGFSSFFEHVEASSRELAATGFGSGSFVQASTGCSSLFEHIEELFDVFSATSSGFKTKDGGIYNLI